MTCITFAGWFFIILILGTKLCMLIGTIKMQLGCKNNKNETIEQSLELIYKDFPDLRNTIQWLIRYDVRIKIEQVKALNQESIRKTSISLLSFLGVILSISIRRRPLNYNCSAGKGLNFLEVLSRFFVGIISGYVINNGRITVFDCCRAVWPEIKPKEEIIQKSAANESMRMMDRNAVRAIYDEQIYNCGKQTIVLCSCSSGEYSYASSEDGSNYSRSLIKAGERWYNKYSGEESFLDILSAHNMAKKNIDVSEGPQTPQIMCAPKGGKGVSYYPFAVNLKNMSKILG